MNETDSIAIQAERDRCAALLEERAARLSKEADQWSSHVILSEQLRIRANEAGYMASMIRCSCGKGLEVSGANHATDCPTYQWWFSNEANVNAGA